MREEEKTESHKVLMEAAKKLLRQQLYEARFVAISHFCREENEDHEERNYG